MNVKKRITPTITIADQPDEADFAALKGEGFHGVVNLRNDGEPEQPIGTAAEGEIVRALGLDYLHYGVGSAPLTEEGVRGVFKFLDEHAAADTLIHCRKAGRAAALVLLYLAHKQGWKPDEAIAKGGQMGLTVEGGLRSVVENYLQSYSG